MSPKTGHRVRVRITKSEQGAYAYATRCDLATTDDDYRDVDARDSFQWRLAMMLRTADAAARAEIARRILIDRQEEDGRPR